MVNHNIAGIYFKSFECDANEIEVLQTEEARGVYNIMFMSLIMF
jgi:hypothetical protein